jgi:tRNA/rRNA methyltransferase
MSKPIAKSTDIPIAMSPLMSVRIVLVEPAGPLNVGSIARIMKNMGFTQLVLVNPQCDPLGSEARQMAVHASDVLEAATLVETLPEALRGCQRAIATTARSRSHEVALADPRTTLPWLTAGDGEAALIFGSEERGLSNEELKYAQRCVCIPSSPVYPSLNLAQAVAICAYELSQSVPSSCTTPAGQAPAGQATTVPQALLSSSADASSPPSSMAAIEDLEAYYQHLETLLLRIGYLYPHTAARRMEKFRQLLNRASPQANEVALLRGILRQIEWAMSAQK